MTFAKKPEGEAYMFRAVNRRDLMSGMAAAGLLPLLPTASRAQAGPLSGADEAFFGALDGFTDEILMLVPEMATQAGLDRGRLAPLRGQLSHRTEAAIARAGSTMRAIHGRLLGVDRGALSVTGRVRYDTVRYAVERGLDGTAFRYGGGAIAGFLGDTGPYVVSQKTGAIVTVPDLLVSGHVVTSKVDAEAYLSRIAAFAQQVGEETALIAEHAGIGVVPPSFIAATALGIMKGFRTAPADRQSLVTNIEAKSQALGLAGYGERAIRILESEVYPAIDRQISTFAIATADATDAPGVHRLPDGDAYYAWALRLAITTTRPPSEVHRIGLEQNMAIKARLDALLKAQGMTVGTVGERIGALNKDPRFLFANTDQGRSELLAYLNQCVDRIRPMMPQLSRLNLKADVIVKRVPPDIEDGVALGYMNPAALDGSRPAIYYVNLKTTELWPRFTLPSLTAHEGIPGHSWQYGYLAEHRSEVPAISSVMNFTAFAEGWALYAEQLVDEGGLYDNDPWGRIGYLQAQQFRACRLVVDTGIHALGWSRDQAINYLVAETGRGRQAMTNEVDRYCSEVGQACGYKMGHTEIVRLRDKARGALGPKFDLAGFDDAVVSTGGVPLELLEPVIDRYIAATRGKGA
jgi:uncharacterized protein (DUF885 family)